MKKFLEVIKVVLGYIITIAIIAWLIMIAPILTGIVLICGMLYIMCDCLQINWDTIKERFKHGTKDVF